MEGPGGHTVSFGLEHQQASENFRAAIPELERAFYRQLTLENVNKMRQFFVDHCNCSLAEAAYADKGVDRPKFVDSEGNVNYPEGAFSVLARKCFDHVKRG